MGRSRVKDGLGVKVRKQAPGSPSRRGLIRGLVATTAFSLTSPALSRQRPPLGIVEITLSRELSRDYAGTLKRLAPMGYTHFGFAMAAGGDGRPSSREKAAMVRDAGLEVGSARLGSFPDTHARDVDDAAAIGAKSIAMSAASVFTTGPRLGVTTRAAFEAWLPQLASLASRCRSAGLTLCYHNHWWDLQPLEGGEAPLDTIARVMSPRDLSFEIDLAWCWYAGVPPLDLVERLGPRVNALHLKDIDRTRAQPISADADRAQQSLFTGNQAVVIGKGEMGYGSLLPRLRRLTSAMGYIEVDRPSDGLAAAAEAASFYKDNV